MCGICGYISIQQPENVKTLASMNAMLRHRGPEDEGYIVCDGHRFISYAGEDSPDTIKNKYPLLNKEGYNKIGMGFRRLSIIDLSDAGHQPMVNAAETIAICFNGEIYNYKELKKELQEKGCHFRSGSDTEVILLGYQYGGIDFIQKLNGMFAIALLDLQQRQLWLIRDRMGIKPLFYHIADDTICWASEIKSLLEAPWVKKEINYSGLAANYFLQTTPAPQTCFKNIFSVKPAHYLKIDLESLSFSEQPYWHIPLSSPTVSFSKEEAAEQVQQLLKKAVRRQLVADVPVISLMSGGIDSTTITAMAAEINPEIKAYTLGFETGNGLQDERIQATAIAKKLNIRQITHTVHPDDMAANLMNTLAHFEEPYSSLEVVVEAARHIHGSHFKTALNGNGADEVMGGYPYVLHLEKWKKRKSLRFLHPFLPNAPEKFLRIKNYLALDSVFRFFANSTQGMRLQDLKMLFPVAAGIDFLKIIKQLEVNEGLFDNDYETLFQYDMQYSVASHHVYRDDLSAMMSSVEMRYPYLDHELIEFVARLPASYRYNGKENKPLLRAVAANYILKENLQMPKKGFALPGHQWILDQPTIIGFAEEQLHHLKKRGLFNHRIIESWWVQKNNPAMFYKIWQLVTTEVWLKAYFD